MLNKKINDRKSNIWFKDHNIVVEIDEANHENYDSDDEVEREHMFKRHDFEIFWCNPNNPSFKTHIFLGEIYFHITKLREKETIYSVINETADDFWKMVTITILKVFCKLIKNKWLKNEQQNN